jgi:hypothetical protein
MENRSLGHMNTLSQNLANETYDKKKDTYSARDSMLKPII